MDKRSFQRVRLIVTLAIVIVVGWAVLTHASIVVPLIGIAIGMTLLFVLKRRTKEVMEDERTHRISDRASRTAVVIFAPALVLAAVVLIVLANTVLPDFKQTGDILAYSGCALVILYNIAYVYHERKHQVAGR